MATSEEREARSAVERATELSEDMVQALKTVAGPRSRP